MHGAGVYTYEAQCKRISSFEKATCADVNRHENLKEIRMNLFLTTTLFSFYLNPGLPGAKLSGGWKTADTMNHILYTLTK